MSEARRIYGEINNVRNLTGVVGSTSDKFAQVIEVPERADNVRFYTHLGELPAPYRHALQRVR